MSNVLAGVTNRDVKALLREVMKAGHAVSLTRGGHVRIDTPQGPYFTGSTTSDWRAVRSLRCDLRRRGVEV